MHTKRENVNHLLNDTTLCTLDDLSQAVTRILHQVILITLTQESCWILLISSSEILLLRYKNTTWCDNLSSCLVSLNLQILFGFTV